MGNIANVDIGVCQVTANGVDLGHTKGGVVFSYDPDIVDVTVDQYGSTPIDKILSGEAVMVKVPLAETSFPNFAIAFPGATRQIGSAGNKVVFGSDAGKSLRDNSGPLVLHPIKRPVSDKSKDITLYKCVATETVELNFEVDNQEVMEVNFQAMVDETKANGGRLGHIGIDTIS